MLERTESLISELEAWCSEKRGRQTELAKAIGVTRQAVNFWLTRRSNPTSEQTLAIVAFLENPEAFRKPGRELAK
jgi:DNA-binding XRE family transcriptional regulator